MSVLDELDKRGLIQECSDREELGKLLVSEKVTFYAGYDPSAQSLHAGNLVPLRVMRALADAGHEMIAVVGGATGMIGDPSGRATERALLDEEALAANLALLRAQIERFVSKDATILDNREWFGMSYLDFLRDVGKHITVNYMLAKDSVHARLNDREQGISYTEFSYMLLQGYDFAWLARHHGVRLQIGGADQWGNITCGIELSRKMGNERRIFGLVAPLLLTASGEKFGKSTGGGKVWLDPGLTEPPDFYKFWVNTSDADVEKYLKMFSLIPLDQIAKIMAEHGRDPSRRHAQIELAKSVTDWVHPAASAAATTIVAATGTAKGTSTAHATAKVIYSAEGIARASAIMFRGELPKDPAEVALVVQGLPTSDISEVELRAGVPLIDLLVRTKLAKTRSAARRLIQQGGVYVNDERQTDLEQTLTLESLDKNTNSAIFLRTGKKDWHILRVV